MAITYPRALLATPGINKFRFTLQSNIEVFASPISNVVQTIDRPGDLWGGFYSFAPKKAEENRAMKAWLLSMKGGGRTFLGYDPTTRNPAGIANTGSDTILVNGASQVGSSLVCDGARFSGVDLLKAGDYFQVGNTGVAIQLKMMLEDASSDGAGNITLNFEPPLHASPTDGAPIIFNNPVGVFRVSIPEAASWEAVPDEALIISFPFVEVPQIA